MKKVKRNPDKPYEDMDGNWIGLWKKDKWDRNSGIAYPRYNKRKVWGSAYKNPDMEKGELEKSIMIGIPAKRIGDASKGFKPYAVTDKED